MEINRVRPDGIQPSRSFVFKAVELFSWISPAIFFASFSFFIATTQGQEELSPLIRAKPNPFRDGSADTTLKQTRRAPSSSQDKTGKAIAADVIRLERLPSHTEPPVVTAMSVGPTGLLAAAGDDHVIRIVELSSGKTISTLEGHLDWVQCLEFSPSGRILASCGNDGTLRIWAMEREPRLVNKVSVEHALLTLTFAGEDRIYAAGFGHNIYRWTSNDDRLVVDHVCECKDIRSTVCSPDQTLLAYGGRDGVLRVRNIGPSSAQANPRTVANSAHADGVEEFAVPLHFDRIRSIQFSDDGKQITSVGEDRRIVHYDLAQRKATGKTEIGGGKLMGLCQLEPNLFAIAGSDNSIRIFNDIDRNVLVKLIGHDGSVSVLKKTSTHIISGSFDTTIRVWDIQHALSRSNQHGKYVHPVAAQFEDSGAGDLIK